MTKAMTIDAMANGWGMLVGGCRPYLASDLIKYRKADIATICTSGDCKPVRVVMIPRAVAKKLGVLDAFNNYSWEKENGRKS